MTTRVDEQTGLEDADCTKGDVDRDFGDEHVMTYAVGDRVRAVGHGILPRGTVGTVREITPRRGFLVVDVDSLLPSMIGSWYLKTSEVEHV